MKITDGLKSLEKALEKELTEFFVILGESEAPEFWPQQAEAKQKAGDHQPPTSNTHH